eukprot:gnl/MRDRNA2_/MRDRNA2_114901_c0_seq1.p1 gnl/MRDRNA2_/MRDRNA2_114901_c0~~gnl/MRDRNA2_/MRDRNA2_114901_c0_seq1.p1  ORF type:complete len:796 (+),score=175.66 gnl/MRDRNA2_/MRDRNA2_114901_c0_seq1:144-2531(+)
MTSVEDQQQLPLENLGQKEVMGQEPTEPQCSSKNAVADAVSQKDAEKQDATASSKEVSAGTSKGNGKEAEAAKPKEEAKVNAAQADAEPTKDSQTGVSGTATQEYSKEQLELASSWRSWIMEKYGSPGAAFRKMDDNGNGTISCSELVSACASWKRGSAVKKLFNLLNFKAKDGVIVWSEFVSAGLPIQNSDKWLAEAEQAGITDASKKKPKPKPELTKEEKLKVDLENFHHWCVSSFDTPTSVLAHFDTNGNGDVSLTEFIDRCGAKRRGKPTCPGDKETWKSIFKVLDGDNSGVIGRKELFEDMQDKFKSKPDVDKGAPAPKQSPKGPKVLKQIEAVQRSNASSAPPSSSRTRLAAAGGTTEYEWTKRTVLNLRGAESLLHNMSSHLRDHVLDGDGGLCKVQQRSHTQSLNQGTEGKVRMRIAGCAEAAKTAEHQIAGVTHAAAEMKRCVRAMRNAHRALWRTLSVCEMRLDLREARIPSEQVRDAFQRALEDEWEITFNAREDLVNRITKGERIILALEQVKEQLTAFLYNKRRDARTERSQMMAERRPQVDLVSSWGYTSRSGSSGGACSLPPAAPEDVQHTTLGNQNAYTDDKALLERAARLEDIARKLYTSGDAAIEAGKTASEEAVAQTEQHMDNRIRKVGHLRDALQQKHEHTQDIIHEAEMSFGRALHSISQMSGSCDAEFSAHLGAEDSMEIGPAGEGADSTDFETDSTLPKKWQATANVLCRLKESGVRLQEDLKHKVHALRIDGMCRKVTPRYASTELGRLRQVRKQRKKHDSEVVEKNFTSI